MHLAKASQVPAELLHFNGCSIDQQVYAVCYSGVTCPALRKKPIHKSCASFLRQRYYTWTRWGSPLELLLKKENEQRQKNWECCQKKGYSTIQILISNEKAFKN